MQNLVPTVRPVLEFEPVPRKYRYDGWTAERQRAFVDALAETGSVKAAAKRINMSYEGAYYLRRQPGADSFRAAWDAALDHGVQCLADIAIERATEGVPVPIFWRGQQVGEKRVYSDRLLTFILRHHMPDRYGAHGLAPGTRNRATVEREAAAHCPVCKARAKTDEAAEAARNPSAEKMKETEQWLSDLLKRYANKVRSERRYRMEGAVVAADFTVRQLTVIEMSLCASSGGSDACVALWEQESERLLNHASPEEDAKASVMARLIDDLRRDVWSEQGMLRPHSTPQDGQTRSTVPRDENADTRIAAQHKARKQLAAAQAMWEAAATVEGWRAWCAAGG